MGQGELLALPFSWPMAAAIANRGYYYTPHIVKGVDGAQIDSAFLTPKYTTIDSIHFETVIDGMYDVFEYGTAKAVRFKNFVINKTGTAQNPHGQDHSILALKDDPKIAIAVIIENGY